MDNKKKYIIIACIIILILIIILVIISNSNKAKVTQETHDELKDEMIEYRENNKNKVTKIEDFSNIGTVRTIVKSYYQSLILTNPDNLQYALISEGDSNYYKEKLLNTYSKEYIEKNNVTKDSIYFDKVVTDFNVDIISLYKVSSYEDSLEEFGNVELYLVNGIFINLDEKSSQEFTMALAVDNVNRNYILWPSDYEEITKYTKFKVDDIVDFEIPKEIEGNEYNKFSTNYTAIDDLARMEYNTVVDLLLYDTDKAFELLSENGKGIYASVSELAAFRDENRSNLYLANYAQNIFSLNNGVLKLDCYDSDNKYKISIEFDGFSSFTYSIEKIK